MADKRTLLFFAVLVGIVLTINAMATWDATLNVDLLGYWELEESSGILLDSYLGVNNGSIQGAGGYQAGGIINYGNFLDEDEEFIILNNSHSFNGDGLTLTNQSTISFWLNFSTDANTPFLATQRAGSEEVIEFLLNEGGDGKYTFKMKEQNGTVIGIEGGDSSLVNLWHHVLSRTNETGVSLWIDGVHVASTGYGGSILNGTGINWTFGGRTGGNDVNATFDEIGIWNRAISDSEISDIYNGGAGEQFISEGLNVILRSPANNTGSKATLVLFNASAESITGGGIPVNATFSLWHNNGTLFNRTMNYSSFDHSTTWNVGGMSDGWYDWNVQICVSTGSCNVQSSNNTFLYGSVPTTEISQSYASQLLEGSYQTFELNMSFDSDEFAVISPTLIYNQTSYIGTTSDTGDYRIYTVETYAPAVNTDVTNNFHWEFEFDNGTRVFWNATENSQEVWDISLDDCTTNTHLLYNFTVMDEEDRTYFSGGVGDNVTVNIDMQLNEYISGDNVLNFSQAYSMMNNASVCLNHPLNDSAYRIDMVVDYQANDYVKEFYYIDNGTIRNSSVPNHIDLHDLLLADSTSFLFTFVDTDGLEVDEAIIHVDRKYIGEGIFREVERAKTDDSGETHVHLVEEDVIYRFRVTKDSELLYTSTEYQAKCLSTPCEIELRASEDYFGTDEDAWDNLMGGYYSVSKDEDNRQISLEFVSEPVGNLNMNFTAFEYSDGTRTVVATDSLTATSGTITLTIPQSYGNVSYVYAVYQDNELIVWGWFSLVQKGVDFFGNTLGVILSALLVLTLGLMAITEGVAVVVFLALGLIVAMILNLIDLGWISLISLILAGGIVIWKLNKRRGG